MPKFLKKVCLLHWKNQLMQLTNRFEILLLIVSPAVMCLIAVYLRMQSEQPIVVDRIYQNIDIEANWLNLLNVLTKRKDLALAANSSFEHSVFIPQMIIAYAPLGYPILTEMMQMSMFSLTPMHELGFENCTELRRNMIRNHYFAGVCFDPTDYIRAKEEPVGFGSLYLTTNKMPIHFNYTLIFPSELRMFDGAYIGANWMTNYYDNMRSTVVQRLNKSISQGHVEYLNEGFINLQLAISQTYLNMLSGTFASEQSIPKVSIRRFPVRNVVYDPLMGFMSRGMVLLIIFGYLFAAQILVMQIVQEKGDLRNYLQNMGFGNIPHFFSWFLKAFFYNVLSSLILLLILKINWNDDFGLYTNTPTFLLLLILLPYNIAAITFCIMLSSFQRQTIAILRLLTLIWLVSYIAFLVWLTDPENLSILFFVICAFPNTLLALILKALYEHESINYTGYSDMTYTLNYKVRHLTIIQCIWLFFAMAFVYCFIALYRDILRVVNFNRAKGFLTRNRNEESDHSLQGSITQNQRTGSLADIERSEQRISSEQGSARLPQWVSSTMIFEVEPTSKHYKVKTRKLSKSYNGQSVLNGISMNMYESEVTVVMGHNGAGKTTLMRILAGLTPPTHGTAIIEGINIRLNRPLAAQLTGIAINEHILYPRMNAYNQLRFTCLLKGLTESAAIEQANYYLKALNLKKKSDVLTKQLSSTERHLLLIANAFCGNSSVVLIDDLHADMDLPTQQLIWNLIEVEKEDRAVIAVTNSSELTEALSDRLALIAHGQLQCTGTKPFLRSMYGHGYRLICVMGTDCRPKELSDFLSNYMPKITVESQIGQRITFVLDKRFEEIFTQLLDNLEKRMQRLDVVSCTLRETSVNDIFMQMGSNSSDIIANELYKQRGKGQSVMEYLDPYESDPKRRHVRKCFLLPYRFCTLMRKSWLISISLWRWELLHCIILTVATSLTYCTLRINGLNDDLTPLSFNLTQVHNLNAIVEFRSGDTISQKLYDKYADILFWYDSYIREMFTKDTDPYFLLQKTNITEAVHFKFFFGASFSAGKVTAWFNNVPLHAAPCSLNTVHNAITRTLLNDDASIEVTLDPLPYEVKPIPLPISPIDFGALLATVLSLCFCLVWSGPLIFLIEERMTHFKKIQFISGANKPIYWLAMFITDLCKVGLLSVIIILITMFFLTSFVDFDILAWLFIALVLSGANLLLIAYLLSLTCRNPAYGYLFIFMVNFLGAVLFVVVLTLRQGNFNHMPESLNFLSQYAFCLSIFKLFYNYNQKYRCEDPQVRFVSVYVDQCKTVPNCCMSENLWNGDMGIQWEILSLLCTLLCSWCFLFLFEFSTIRYTLQLPTKRRRKLSPSEFVDHNLRHVSAKNFEIDENVIRERARVANIQPTERQHYAVICHNLGKSYKERRVINRVDLALMHGESFGLLGLSGSGKTTLIRVMMGHILPTQGNIYVLTRTIGYCPQTFRLPQHFTPRQILEVCAQLRGMTLKKATTICENLARMLGFHESYNFRVAVCSDGVMRRISVALAVLSEPDILYMDGAPSGIDVAGKVLIFDIISTIRERGTTIVFSSLNSSECEFMCDRIAILLSGQFWSLGEMNHLHQRHSDGYMVAVRMKRQVKTQYYQQAWARAYKEQIQVLPSIKFIAFMETEFPKSCLKEQRGDILIFFIPIKTTKLSTIFYKIRRNVFTLSVEDFNITRNSLSSIYTDIMAAELKT